MRAVRTPLATTTALALGNRLWRKQVIREGDLHYDGGQFALTGDYLDSVVAAFHDGAITSVPFTFVDDGGRHSEAPERRKGRVVGLERTQAGIDAILDLDDDAAALVEKDPRFGVSVLIKHSRTTGDGAQYPAVLAHVAGTFDPVIRTLDPWKQEIAASNGVTDDVLDLLALTARPPAVSVDVDTTDADRAAVAVDAQMAEPDAAPASPAPAADETPVSTPPAGAPADPEENPVADTSTTIPEEDLEQFRLFQQFLAHADLDTDDTDIVHDDATDADNEQEVGDDGDGSEELTDAELDAIAHAAFDETAAADIETPDLIAASHVSNELALANARLDAQALALAQMTADRDRATYEKERDDLVRLGIPARIVDLARPLMEGTQRTVALSNGRTVDAGRIVRDVIRELGSTLAALNLSHELGSDLGVDRDKPETPEEFAARAAAELNR